MYYLIRLLNAMLLYLDDRAYHEHEWCYDRKNMIMKTNFKIGSVPK